MDNDLKTIKSLLLLGASAFCFALTGAGVATYAFFDISEGAKVSHLELGVDGGGSLLLGLRENLSGDITYYQDVDDETLSRHYPSYSPGASLSPVSSMMRDSWLLPSFDLNTGFPVFYGDYGEYDDPASPRVARQGYIQFEAYFLSDEDGYLYLGQDTGITPLEEENRAKEEEKELPEGTLDKVVEGVRVSFLSSLGYQILDCRGGEKATYAGPLDINGDGYREIDSSGKEILYGEYEGEPVFGEPLSEETINPDGTKSKKGSRPLLEEESAQNGLTIAKEESKTLEELTNPGTTSTVSAAPIARLSANVPERTVITIYLEGWDKEVNDLVEDGSFSLKLEFNALLLPLSA